MGISFNEFLNQDSYTITAQKRYNAQGKEIETGLTFLFMDMIQDYINSGDLKDNNADGLENVFSSTDKKNLFNKFMEIHKNHTPEYGTNFTTMNIGDTFTYSKEEIFALAEAAGYVVTNPITESEAKAEKEPENSTAKIKEEVPEVVEQAPVTGGETDETAGENSKTTTTITTPINETESTETVIEQSAEASSVPVKEAKDPDTMVPKVSPEKEAAPVPVIPLSTKEETNSVPAEAEQVMSANEDLKKVIDETPAPAVTEQEQGIPAQDEEQDKTSVSSAADEENHDETHDEKLTRIRKQQIKLELQIKELSNTQEVTTAKKRFLGFSVGTKTTTREYTQTELESRAAQKTELEQQLEELKKQEVWVRDYESAYWSTLSNHGYTVLEDGTYSEQSNRYQQVTTTDGKRIAQVTAGMDGINPIYEYYDVTAEKVGDPILGHDLDYYAVVPDFAKGKLEDITAAQIVR